MIDEERRAARPLALGWRDIAPIPARPELQLWSSLTEAEAEALRQLAAGRSAIEIGAGFGFSTLAMAAVAERVWSVDPHDKPPSRGYFGLVAKEAMDRYALGTLAILCATLDATGLREKVAIHRGLSQVLLAPDGPLEASLAGKADMAFIDGDHRYEAAIADLENCERLLTRPALVAVHDYGEANNPEVAPAVDDWREGRPMRLVDTLAVIEL